MKTVDYERMFPYNRRRGDAIMGKKLEGNGMWESSRMMLPEHVARIRELERNIHIKEKPELDEYALAEIYGQLSESYAHKTEIKLKLYDRLEDLYVIGVVERVDTIGGRVRINADWFSVYDVISATTD